MKKLVILLLLCLVLCGCTADPVEEPTVPPETQPTEFVEPTGIYDPESSVEDLTGGAVRCYPLNTDMVHRMELMGEYVLVFSGSEGTVLTCYTGENLYIHAQLQLPFWLSDAPSTQVTDKGVSYLDPNTREMVFLDVSLKEIRRFAVPETLTGDPVMTENRQVMYYCTDESIRALDLETGIDRLLKQISYPSQTLEDILLNGTVLQCGVGDEAGSWETLFIDTQTGQTLERTRKNLTVVTRDEKWYASVAEGSVRSLIYGIGTDIQQLYPRDIAAAAWYLPDRSAAVTASAEQDITVEYYDLESGLCTAAVHLEVSPWYVSADKRNSCVWMLSTDSQTGQAVLLRWDTAQSAAADEQIHTGPRYTEKNPDQDALENCREEAKSLGERYGIDIYIGADATAVQPWDYTLETEYSAPVILRYLDQLETVLSWYPADFFSKAMAATESGRLKVCIVRSLTGTPESGSLNSATGVQYWIDGEAYLALAVGDSFCSTFCHEMCHAAETLVYAQSNLFDDWDWLNPEGFEYDFDFVANEKRDGSEYLQEENRAFIDTYSMSFPKEDRARIMEYAMLEGNGSYFQSEIMQNKLRTLCVAIREAFGWKKSEETFRWEQYLNESIAYQKKK